MIKLPLQSSEDLLARLDRVPRVPVAADDAFRALAADLVRLRSENRVLARELKALQEHLASR